MRKPSNHELTDTAAVQNPPMRNCAIEIIRVCTFSVAIDVQAVSSKTVRMNKGTDRHGAAPSLSKNPSCLCRQLAVQPLNPADVPSCHQALSELKPLGFAAEQAH